MPRRRPLPITLFRALLPLAAGIVVGVAGALLSARLLSAFLYGVTGSDPVAIIASAVTLLAVGAAAALVLREQ